jgi:hypothetical protein
MKTSIEQLGSDLRRSDRQRNGAKKKALPIGNAFWRFNMERGLAIGPGPFPVLEQT